MSLASLYLSLYHHSATLGTLQTHLSVPVYPPDISSREGSISLEHHYPSPDTCPYLSTLQIPAVAERAQLEREEW